MKSKKQSVGKSKKDVKATARSIPKSAAEKSRIRVLIVDDHSVVREGLASLISPVSKWFGQVASTDCSSRFAPPRDYPVRIAHGSPNIVSVGRASRSQRFFALL